MEPVRLAPLVIIHGSVTDARGRFQHHGVSSLGERELTPDRFGKPVGCSRSQLIQAPIVLGQKFDLLLDRRKL